MTKRLIPVHWNDIQLGRLHNPFADVPDTTLNNYEMELRRLTAAVDAEAARLRSVQALVVEAQRRRQDVHNVVVSDHAIVHYLERYEGMDLARVEDAILAMAREGRPEVAIKERVVITVLPEGSGADSDLR